MSADKSPVPGVKERIAEMLRRHAELAEDVSRLDTLVEDQRKELEMQNSSRLGGIYDDDDGVVVTQIMIDEEEGQVHLLEEKIKNMQEQVQLFHTSSNIDFSVGWENRFSLIYISTSIF